MFRPSKKLVFCGFTVFALGFAGGCASEEVAPAPPITSIYAAPASLSDLDGPSFFDHPWPSDFRLEAGAPRFEGYPNPRKIKILAEYIKASSSLVDGFSPAAAGYVRFSGPLDVGSLPRSPLEGLDAGASVQLIDIDPDSTERGQRKLISLLWREEAGVYWPANTLSFMPTFGFPLRPRTRYAFVVTDALKSEGGGAVNASPELRQALGLDAATSPGTTTLSESLAPAVSELSAIGVDPARIVQLAVFTTNDPTSELFAVRDHLRETVAAPKVRGSIERKTQTMYFDEYVGEYGPSPNYQVGEIPFTIFGDGGSFNVKDGKPEVVDYFYLRFSLAVPKADVCPMPENGYPIVLYAHGTGGFYRSYIHDETASWLASRCIATMGVDQIFHGNRPGAPKYYEGASESLLFFNTQNIIAARTNARQGAVDEVQRARLFTETKQEIGADVSVTGSAVRFDPTKVMFFGHSQGGLNGPLYLAADDASPAAVLSGASAVMSITLNEKTKPQPSVVELVRLIFLALNEEEAVELSPFHPAISLAQTIVDVVDPIHYARSIALEPREGFAPKSVYMTEGINPDGIGDSYAPPHGIEAHAIAMGLPLQEPWQSPILELAWGGPAPVKVGPEGLSANLPGGATGLLAQWPIDPGRDGHFVIFSQKGARLQSTDFLRSFADKAPGAIPPPDFSKE
ncbi:MAG: hypothetical protein HUU21_33670 [Polyangiaceae bacterium]|nr:hypothetical protein [Polyangiaceae bacterium]